MIEAKQFTSAEKEAYRKAFAPTATDDQWSLFINECERRALVPGIHVVFQIRDAKEWNEQLKGQVDVKKVVFITTIAALRLIAERAGKYAGHGPFTYYYKKTDGSLGFDESKVPLGTVPHAVSVEGFRKDWQVPLFATARYMPYVQTKDGQPTYMWQASPEEMTAKCCEALMLRAVAPEECAGLLITEELGNGLDKEESALDKLKSAARRVDCVPAPTIAPAVNQTAEVTVETEQINNRVFATIPTPDPELQKLLKETLAKAEPGTTVTIGPAIEEIKVVVLDGPGPEQTPIAAAIETAVVELAKKVDAEHVATVTTGVPATKKEHDEFMARAAKVVRDKLPKAGLPPSETGNMVLNYFLTGAGVKGLRLISAETFERLLKAVEDGTPEEAAAIVKAAK